MQKVTQKQTSKNKQTNCSWPILEGRSTLWAVDTGVHISHFEIHEGNLLGNLYEISISLIMPTTQKQTKSVFGC